MRGAQENSSAKGESQEPRSPPGTIVEGLEVPEEPEPPMRVPTAASAAELAVAMEHQLAAIEAQASGLLGDASSRIDVAWEQTLEHLLLLEASVAELQATATDTADATNALLAAATRLCSELRGVDLLAGRVMAVRQAVERLEKQVRAVLAG